MKEVRITPKKREILNRMELYTAEDILQYFPYRYDAVEFVDYDKWQINSRVVVEGMVVSKPRIFRYGRNRSVVNFDIENEYNVFRISVFNQQWYLKTEVGTRFTVVGKYEGNNKIVASSISRLSKEEVCGIKPVYSLKDDMKPKYFSDLIRSILEANRDEIEDFIPQDYKNKYGFMDRYEALYEVHFPSDSGRLAKAINTLKYEEFLKFQTYMLKRRELSHEKDERYAKTFSNEDIRTYAAHLPFELTQGQKTAVNEILTDMRANHQMYRLLQGDVGCGKTVVSFIAMYACYLSGQQSCLMAPTEILAKQHFQNIQKLFEGYNIKMELLYSGLSSAKRKEILARIASKEVDFVVGTHALFQEDVVFADLGLVVTDEQHRFGVKQRQLLVEKGSSTDVLLMSATPIPRTLASSLYGDMDVSTITETPNAGKKIHTVLIRKNSFMAIIDEIEQKLDEGNQMYVVCAAIEKSDDQPVRNVNDIYANLSRYFGERRTVGLLHGQMSEEEKDAVHRQFRDKKIDILVSTTVIEVGVDVKDANIMIIYDANRFGLSQLHQLRGRIGRGDREGYCYLLTDSQDEEALKRLQVIVENTDGFKISYYDLKLRGPGDILGYRQSGLPTFLLGNVILDSDILEQARKDAAEILKNLQLPENKAIRDYLDKSDDTAWLA